VGGETERLRAAPRRAPQGAAGSWPVPEPRPRRRKKRPQVDTW